MTHDEAARHVFGALRRVRLGADPAALLDQPLGADGLGLDSLGVVEFLIELEGKLDISFPDEFWNLPRTLADIVDFVAANHGIAPAARPKDAVPAVMKGSSGDAIREQGFWSGLRWIGTRVAERCGRVLYVRQRQLVLERDLTTGPFPALGAALSLTFRAAQPADGPGLRANGFWPPFRADYWQRLFAERFTTGYHCFVALHQDQIVGIDWVSGRCADTALIGLRVEMRPGSCIGENLIEHRAYRHRGVGLALLGFSLDQARKMGYARQVALVNVWNHRMRMTAGQLLGFRPVGEVVTTWRFGQPRTAWHVEGPEGVTRGEGGTMTL